MWCTSTQPASAQRPETRWRFHLSRCPGFGVHFFPHRQTLSRGSNICHAVVVQGAASDERRRSGSDNDAADNRKERSSLAGAAARVRDVRVSQWTGVRLVKPGAPTAASRVLTAGLLCLGIAAVAYGALQAIVDPTPAFIHVRWSSDVDERVREESERRYSLSEGALLDGRTWGYVLSDLSRANIRALVGDPAVEDTQDIQRAEFRVSPSAQRRPVPSASHPWIPGALWAVTVLCLFIGLFGISVGLVCTAPGFLDSGLTVFASTRPRPARRGRVAPARGFGKRISGSSPI